MTARLKKAGWREKVLVLLGRRRIILVDGDSMYPVLKSGDRVIVCSGRQVAVGDIVLARHPFKSSVQLIKRVAEINDDGRYFLMGDNPIESSDSRSFGTLASDSIIGRVTSRF